MLWYNTVTHTLQSVHPAGNNAVSAGIMKKYYGDWEKVNDDFRPPVVISEPTKEEKQAKTDAVYKSNKEALSSYYLEAAMVGDTDMQDAIKKELVALNNQYDIDCQALESE